MSRIIVVSELFYPDGTSTAHILTKIADHLYNEHEILILAGPESYSSDNVKGVTDTQKPYPIERISIKDYDKNKLLSRTLKFFITSIKLGRLLWKNGRRGDDVLIVTNPAPFLIIASIIKKLRGFKLNILVHDVFPENAVAAGVFKSRRNVLYRIAKKIFTKAYRSADKIIVLGRDMKAVFEEKLKTSKRKPEIEIIENWADTLVEPYDGLKSSESNVRILYAGNIGRCQGLEQFIKSFEKAANENIQLIIRGGGALVPEIQRLIEQTQANIVLGGAYSRGEQFDILSNCDIALVTLADGMYGLGVPSKSYNIMAAGKPILFVGDQNSEIALAVKENKMGFCFANSDATGLERWLSELSLTDKDEFKIRGENASLAATTKYSESVILSKYSQLFSNK